MRCPPRVACARRRIPLRAVSAVRPTGPTPRIETAVIDGDQRQVSKPGVPKVFRRRVQGVSKVCPLEFTPEQQSGTPSTRASCKPRGLSAEHRVRAAERRGAAVAPLSQLALSEGLSSLWCRGRARRDPRRRYRHSDRTGRGADAPAAEVEALLTRTFLKRACSVNGHEVLALAQFRCTSRK
jgi:hypothetical protein